MIHDRPHHLAQRRIIYLLRRALGDLFLGPYSAWLVLKTPSRSPLDEVTGAASLVPR
jgi:hypothetical protein